MDATTSTIEQTPADAIGGLDRGIGRGIDRAMHPIEIDPIKTYGQAAVAAAFNVTERTVLRWRKKRSGFPRPFLVGHKPHWTGRALLTWFNNRQEEAQS